MPKRRWSLLRFKRRQLLWWFSEARDLWHVLRSAWHFLRAFGPSLIVIPLSVLALYPFILLLRIPISGGILSGALGAVLGYLLSQLGVIFSEMRTLRRESTQALLNAQFMINKFLILMGPNLSTAKSVLEGLSKNELYKIGYHQFSPDLAELRGLLNQTLQKRLTELYTMMRSNDNVFAMLDGALKEIKEDMKLGRIINPALGPSADKIKNYKDLLGEQVRHLENTDKQARLALAHVAAHVTTNSPAEMVTVSKPTRRSRRTIQRKIHPLFTEIDSHFSSENLKHFNLPDSKKAAGGEK